MSCIGNPAKNIGYTIVDSNLGLRNDGHIDYGNMLEVSRGALHAFWLTDAEISTIEDEIISACIKKYVLR
jgi:hypothetical protein